MIVKKRHVLLIIGMFLMLQTYSNIIRLIPSFFDNGSAVLEYNITSQVPVDEIKNIIYKNTDIEKDNIIIKVEDKKLLIELPYIEIETTRALDDKISFKFSESIEVLQVTSIGPIDLNEKFIIVFFMLCMVFLIGLVCFVKGLLLFFYIEEEICYET